MTLIAALTGGFGLLSSFVMLQLGLDSMAIRYPLAVCCAYLCFLFLVWLWLRTNAEDYLDLPDLSPGFGNTGRGQGSPAPEFRSGEGGDFGGGGASASFEASSGASDVIAIPPDGLATGASAPFKEVLSPIEDADELAIPLVALALAVGLAIASLYVIYIAPVVFAEVLVDGALSYALFRHLRGHDPRHWLTSAVSRTVVPFAATAVFVAILGAAMSAYAPGAVSIGQVFGHTSAAGTVR
ncbi:hypothetical protein [Thauera sp. SDU_THAU2]|uniref:hypothetical protein n=1 Tax=Thauera sp. SDU_THAU2 TaxID=3136633 RepID=UPI00311D7FE6